MSCVEGQIVVVELDDGGGHGRAGGVGEDDGIVAHHHFVEVLFIRLEGHRGLPAGDILPGQLLKSVEGAALGCGGERDGQRQKQRQRDDTKLLQTTQLLCKAFWKELPYAPIIQHAPPSSTAFHAPFHALFTEGCGRFFSGMRMAASAALSEKCAISRILHVGSYLLRKQRPLQGSTQKFPSKKHSAYKMKKIGNMVLHMDYLTKLRPRVHSILSYHHAYDRPPSLPVVVTKLVGTFLSPTGLKAPVAWGFSGDFSK